MKLSIRGFGPYKVTKVKDNDRYDVIKVGDGEGPIDTNASACRMSPWRGAADDLDSNYDWDSEDDDEDEGGGHLGQVDCQEVRFVG